MASFLCKRQLLRNEAKTNREVMSRKSIASFCNVPQEVNSEISKNIQNLPSRRFCMRAAWEWQVQFNQLAKTPVRG
jgi:hypothetical protein